MKHAKRIYTGIISVYNGQNWFIVGLVKFCVKVGIVKKVDYVIMERDGLPYGVLATVRGPKLLVDFLSSITEYRGKDRQSWEIRWDNSGNLNVDDFKKL